MTRHIIAFRFGEENIMELARDLPDGHVCGDASEAQVEKESMSI